MAAQPWVYNVFSKLIFILVMASPWEDTDIPDTADPTDPSVDDDESNTTQPFTPGASSTPYQPPGASEEYEMSQLPQEQSGQDTDPLLTGDELDQRLQQTRQGSAWADLLEMYPQANKDALQVDYQKDKQGNPRLLIKMVGRGKKIYPLFTKNAVTRQLRENPNLSQEIKTYLGKSMGEQMKDFQQEKARKEAELAAKQKQLEQIQQRAAERQQHIRDLDALNNQIRDKDARMRELEDTHGSLNEEVIQRLKDEKRALEAEKQTKQQELAQLQKLSKQDDKIRTEVDKLMRDKRGLEEEERELRAKRDALQPLNELKQKAEELETKITEDKRIIEDENTSSSERAAAEARVAENEAELERVNTDIEVRERQRPLLERVKDIFKKYGWTLQAVALAVGIVLSALALAATNGLKAGTKAIGNGLKAIGQKLGSLLPGLIGSIVSYIFKAAGSVLSFLGEHAWLLILAVVAFFMERLLKRRRKQ